MRKVTFGGANSLDNYFARVDDSVDWIMWSDEVAEIIKTYWANVDTILMGPETFEAAKQINPKLTEFKTFLRTVVYLYYTKLNIEKLKVSLPSHQGQADQHYSNQQPTNYLKSLRIIEV